MEGWALIALMLTRHTHLCFSLCYLWEMFPLLLQIPHVPHCIHKFSTTRRCGQHDCKGGEGGHGQQGIQGRVGVGTQNHHDPWWRQVGCTHKSVPAPAPVLRGTC